MYVVADDTVLADENREGVISKVKRWRQNLESKNLELVGQKRN